MSQSPRSNSAYVNMDDKDPRGSFHNVNKNHQKEYTPVNEGEDRRSRHLSEAERRLAQNPEATRESFRSVESTDKNEWHSQSLDVITNRLGTNGERGLAQMQAEQRLTEYGPNSLEEDPRSPIWIIFLLQFYNLIIGMLFAASIISLGFQEWVEGIAILFIVTLNATVATYQEYSAGNALEALASLSSPQCAVIRDGEEVVIESKNIVPGDVIALHTGDVVPADIRLVDSVDLKVNEMLLTGESEDVAKRWNADMSGSSSKLTADNMVFSSTTCTAGNGRGIVVETGMSTRVGSIAMLLKSKDEGGKKNCWTKFLEKHQPKLTPLQRSLHKLGFVMGGIAGGVCLIVFIVGYVRDTPDLSHPDRALWLSMLMVAVSLAVSAVPEGLPMVVTICLSSGTADMVKRHVLVRKLSSVETLGAASVICTDKTGTLTEGKMTAVKMWGDFKEYDITGKGFTPEGDILHNGESQIAESAKNAQVRATLLSCVLCSNTIIQKEEDEDGHTGWAPRGNTSEAPLIVAAAKAGIWENNVIGDYKRVAEVPFSSERKMMITVNQVPDNAMFDIMQFDAKTKYVANVKGAPNYILKNCTRMIQKDGSIVSLSDHQRQQVMEAVDGLSSQALRVLAVAVQPMSQLPFAEDCDDVDEKFAALSHPLVFAGLMASIDPARDGVADAIETARTAGIRTVMITGDYLKTAAAIAKNIKLLEVGADAESEATDCSELRPKGDVYLSDPDLDEITSRTLVFARAKPEDKIEIVKSLQRQGLISAMTGDGVNDAPALKESDIGVAMGLAGTEVAKGASDMILTDDNFVSIVSAVEKGRCIYANIQKFVVFLLSTNIGEILLIFTSVAAGTPLPLEALQILILNLFSDGMPAVALSLEAGDPDIMFDQPRPKEQHLIHGRLWFLVLANAVLIASGALMTYFLGLYWNFNMFLTRDIIEEGGGVQGPDDDPHYENVTCKRWYGINTGWKTLGQCGATYKDGSRIFPEGVEQYGVYETEDMYCEDSSEYFCFEDGVGRVQTMTFICITMTEVLRAYTVRSFTEPVWHGMFSNRLMQYAAALSICLTVFVTNVPVVMDDIFGFRYIDWWNWLLAIAGALNSVFWGEIIKLFLRTADKKASKQAHMDHQFENVLLEIRNLRHHLERIEANQAAIQN